MKRIVGILSALWIAMSVMAPSSWADLAPPPGYVEHCTLSKQQKEPNTCQACSSGHSSPQKCSQEWKEKGYVKLCQTRGASAWEEIWCKNPEGKKLYEEGVYNTIGCNSMGQPGNLFLLLLGLVLLFAFSSRGPIRQFRR